MEVIIDPQSELRPDGTCVMHIFPLCTYALMNILCIVHLRTYTDLAIAKMVPKNWWIVTDCDHLRTNQQHTTHLKNVLTQGAAVTAACQ